MCIAASILAQYISIRDYAQPSSHIVATMLRTYSTRTSNVPHNPAASHAAPDSSIMELDIYADSCARHTRRHT